jgi:hypothetical protein
LEGGGSYFKQHSKEVTWEKPRLDGIEFKQLGERVVSGLEAAFEVLR